MEKQAKAVLFTTAALLTVMLWWSWRNRPPEPVQVSVGYATIQDIYNSVTVPGTIEAAESTSVIPAEDAVVDQVLVRIGDKVKRGDILCTLIEADAGYSGYAGGLQNMWAALTETTEDSVVAESSAVLCAPQDGTVLSLPMAGEHVYAGLPCLQIAKLTSLQVCVQAPELFAAAIECGQQANVTASAMGDIAYSATVSSISPVAVHAASLMGTPATATVEAILPLHGNIAGLRPGYSVSAKIFTDYHPNAVAVPIEAVCQRGKQEYVFSVEQGRAIQHEVTTGYMLESVIEIEKGLSGGEQIILFPVDTLTDGALVEVQG